MSRQHMSAWLSELYRRRSLFLALLLVLGLLVPAGLWLRAWYHFRQGRVELQQYHPEKARRHLAACLQLWPRDVTAHLLAARAARQLGEYDEAEEHLRQAQRGQREQSEEVVLEWALHRATLGDVDRTEAYLLPMTREDSERALLACEALAEGCRRNYRIPQGLAMLDLWLERRPNNVRALLLRGHLWGQISSYGRAVPDYRRVLEQDPEQEEARRWLAVCLVESSNWHEALPYLEDLHRQHPDNPDVCMLLARCLLPLGQRQQARQLLQAALAQSPQNPMALRSLGETLLQDRQPAEAETWLRRALEVAPQDYKTHWFLYGALRQQDKTSDAEQQLEQTEQLERRWQRFRAITQHELAARPRDVALHAELGALLLDLGHRDAGRDWLLNALRRDPQCRPAHEALARYYQQKGEVEKATHHRRQARALPASTAGTVLPERP
jgi:tetratricopeptide (TPR) repeat protein